MQPGEPNPKLDRVQHELRASGIKPESANPLRSGIHTRGYLPHVKREGAVYFVTFRLADSLPKEMLLKLLAEKAQRLRRLEVERSCPQPKPLADSEENIERDYIRQVERYLDKGAGACVLRRPDLAELVAGAIRFFVGQRYRLDAWVVMPNHVHAVFWPIPNHTVSEILKSWKQYTATRANRILDRVGTDFWQPESFDHWIRDDAEHDRCCRYVVHNPVTAGLCKTPENWRWSSAWSGHLRSCSADFLVAQISNLLYRRFPTCRTPESSRALTVPRPADWKSAIQQVGNLRYGGAARLHTGCGSAWAEEVSIDSTSPGNAARCCSICPMA